MTRDLVEPGDIEPEVELFDATNVEHAKKLAAALWAVDIEIRVVDAPPAERWTMRDAAGNVAGSSIVTKDHAAEVRSGQTIRAANGVQLSLGERTELVPMCQIAWFAKIGEHRYGNSIIVPADCKRDGLKSISANMVHTMLAMVVNGTISRAPVDYTAALARRDHKPDNGGN